MSTREKSSDDSGLEFAGTFTMYSFISLLIIQGVICILSKNRGNSSFAIWYNISYLQVITWVNLLKIDPNSEFETFFKQISIIFRPIKIVNLYSCEELNHSGLKALQIHSHGIINNVQYILIVYSPIIFVCLLLISLDIYTKIKFLTKLIRVLKYSLFIRLHLLFFLDLTILSMVNIRYFTGNSTCSNINLGVSIILVTINVVFIILLPIFIKKTKKRSRDNNLELTSQSFETLFGEFAPSSSLQNFQYYTMYLIHRLTLSFTLVNFQKAIYLQLFVMITSQLTISNSYSVYYICKVSPYKFKIDAKTTLLSESLTLLLFILFYIRALNFSPDANYYLTVVCVFIIWVTEICNIIKFLFALRSITRLDQEITNEPKMQKVVETQDALGQTNSKEIHNVWVDELDCKCKIDVEKIVEDSKPSKLKKNRISNSGILGVKRIILNNTGV